MKGVEGAGAEYAAILKKHGMIPSMSRPANPYDMSNSFRLYVLFCIFNRQPRQSS